MLPDPSSCACTTLRRAARAVTRLYDEVMVETGLSLAQFSVLRSIARDEPIPLMLLAERLVMDRTTLYRALRPLARDRWIAIESGAGRSKTVRMTEAGRRTMEEATPAWAAAQARLLGAVDEEEWAATRTSLDRLVAVVAAR